MHRARKSGRRERNGEDMAVGWDINAIRGRFRARRPGRALAAVQSKVEFAPDGLDEVAAGQLQA